MWRADTIYLLPNETSPGFFLPVALVQFYVSFSPSMFSPKQDWIIPSPGTNRSIHFCFVWTVRLPFIAALLSSTKNPQHFYHQKYVFSMFFPPICFHIFPTVMVRAVFLLSKTTLYSSLEGKGMEKGQWDAGNKSPLRKRRRAVSHAKFLSPFFKPSMSFGLFQLHCWHASKETPRKYMGK